MTARALTIGGSDPTGAAGIAADIAMFTAAGVHGMAIITAVTVQDTASVIARNAVAPDIVRAQLEAVLADLAPDAIKIGLLPAAGVVRVCADLLAGVTAPVVLDPVLVATSGDVLADPGVVEAIGSSLVPIAAVVTPNAAEASALTGLDVGDREGQFAAAEAIVAMGAAACVVTGGHLEGAASVDVFVYDRGRARGSVGSARFGGGPVRGTGCRFSAALTAQLARGVAVPEAIEGAHRAGTAAAMRSSDAGRGARMPGLPVWMSGARAQRSD